MRSDRDGHGATAGLADRARSALAPAIVVGLLLATSAAFVLTEKLKLTPTPILDTAVTKTFSPTCRCVTDLAGVTFRLRHAGQTAVDVIRPDGRLVRRLFSGPLRAGLHAFTWDGRDESRSVGRDGGYKIRVRLFSAHRTIVLPNLIRLDTVPPTVAAPRLSRLVIRIGERLRVAYSLSQVAHPMLLVDGRLVVIGRFAKRSGTLDWYGKIDGNPVRPGLHRLSLRARDSAGNVSLASAVVTVRVKQASAHATHRRRRRTVRGRAKP